MENKPKIVSDEKAEEIRQTIKAKREEVSKQLKELRKELHKDKKREYNTNTYKERLTTKVQCDICGITIDKYALKIHKLTKKHIKNVEDIQKLNAVQDKPTE